MISQIILAAVLLGSVVDARVTFIYSEVLQQTDVPDYGDKAAFKCDNGCQVYTDSKSSSLYITKLNDKMGIYEAVTTFSNIGGSNKTKPEPYALKASDKYFVDNRGDLNPFVFYVVDNQAPNFGTPVYVITDDAGLHILGTTEQRITILNGKTAAVTWSKYGATIVSSEWGPGFPKIFATGFDMTNVHDYCNAVFHGTSLKSLGYLSVTVPTPISTIDFGDNTPHVISVAWNKNASVEHALTTTYVTPGYHGCPFNPDEAYSSTLNASLHDAFTFTAKKAILSGYLNLRNSFDALDFKINDDEIRFYGWSLTPQCFNKTESYTVSVDWAGHTPGASFAVQLDFDTESAKYGTVNIDSAGSSTSESSLTPSSAANPMTASTTTSMIATTSGASVAISVLSMMLIFLMTH